LVEASWNGAPLEDVVGAELAGFTERVRAAGPDVRLSASAVQTFALIVHELLTNAAKYGALSNAEGEVSVSWNLASDGAKDYLEFSWHERGGPPVIANGFTGFGFSLISAMGRSLTSAPNINLKPSGLECKIRVPMETILPNIKSEFQGQARQDEPLWRSA
jgi:two-component sensor histidine kinase